MKRILITAGGTGIAWHICKIAKEYYSNEIELHICDINSPELIPTSVYADHTHTVPLSSDPSYIEIIKEIIENNKIDIVIPLLPNEGEIFAKDSEIIKELNVSTTAPVKKVFDSLTDKNNLYYSLKQLNIGTPIVISDIHEIDPQKMYIIKPKVGFGSNGVKLLNGKIIIESGEYSDFDKQNVIQEYCGDGEEVTVECFNYDGRMEVFARQRIAVKSGVCVKTKVIDSSPFMEDFRKLVANFEMPIAFNAQYLLNNEEWKLFDLNLRLGAGTPLATAYGFQLTRAMLSSLLGHEIIDDFFKIDHAIKSVLRVYQEIVIR